MNAIKRVLGAVLVAIYCVSLCAMGASAVGVGISLSPAELSSYAALQQQEAYRVGYTPDHAPFTYQDAMGNVHGMAIEMMNYMADIAEIEVEYISLDALAEDETVDINLSVLCADQRAENSIASVPYYQFSLMLMGKHERIDCVGATVGHLGYAAFDDATVERDLPGCVSVTYDNFAALEAAFHEGEVEYLLATSLIAQDASNLDMVRVATGMSLDAMLMFESGMSQDKIDAFNALIQNLDHQIVASIVLNAAIVASNEPFTILRFFTEYAMQILLFIACIIGIIVTIVLVASINKRKALETMLNVDELTGLMTEHKFLVEVRKTLNKAKAEDVYYLISFDIDNFKYINEIHGYLKGTQAIQAFARTLAQAFSNAECIARPFADNFILLTKVPPYDGHSCGKKVCNNCMQGCLDGILGVEYRLITSAGIYQVVDKSLSLSYMIDCANIARCQGKGVYKSTQWVFTKDLEDSLKMKNEIIHSMEKSLREKEFKIYYQPKIDFQTEKITGAEAMVRWFRGDGTQYNPSEFINLFEENRFIVRLDYYVLSEVAAFLVAHPSLCKVSVNVSGNTFLDPDMIARITEITAYYGISPTRLEIEITESAIVNEFEIISHRIDELKSLGFTVSMDDFGAGVSSLHRLKDIAIDVIKIDKEFLGTQALSKKGEAIIASIVAMAQKLGVKTVVEGVETQKQVDLLRGLSCDVAQGFFYARPLPEEDFLAYVEAHR